MIRLVDINGNTAASYRYDPYGKALSALGSHATINPLRYRGYVFDHETGLYYLQSRYYDPETGRFLNADAFASTGQGLLGNNMFAYCLNNPVNMLDPSGNIPQFTKFIPPVIPQLIAGFLDLIEENKRHNSEADRNRGTTTKNKIINDQNGTTGEAFVYGNYNASWNICEVAAIHNVSVLCGLDSSLSETIVLAQCAGIMIGDGFFGSNPYALGRVLSLRGLKYTRVDVDEMTNPGVYIISFWNKGAPWNGLHTVAVSYDGIMYTAYNLYGDGYEYSIDPKSYADRFIIAYYIGG